MIEMKTSPNGFHKMKQILWFDDWTHDEIRHYRINIRLEMVLMCKYFNSPCKHPSVYSACPDACNIWELARDSPGSYRKWNGERRNAVSLPENALKRESKTE